MHTLATVNFPPPHISKKHQCNTRTGRETEIMYFWARRGDNAIPGNA